MVPPTPTPSARLVRAAAAERGDIARHRERLLGARDRLHAELAGIETALRDLDERDALLDRLAGPAPVPGSARPAEAHATGAPPPSSNGAAVTALGRDEARPAAPGGSVSAARDAEDASRGGSARPLPPRSRAAGERLARLPAEPRAGDAARTPAGHGGATVLRGPAIRRAAIEVLRALPERTEALHYRAWFDAVRAAGFDVAGKDPLAVFLTQLSRSPVVRRGTQSGVYEVDADAPRRLRDRLDALHADLRGLTAAPSATADLTAIRARRGAITTQITQVEKALEEAEAVLAPSGDRACGSVAVTG
jgi:hypothetical protein